MSTVSVEGLRHLVVRGMAWKVGGQVFNQVLRIAVGLVLARLLAPHDYGLAAMVVVFSGLAFALSDLSLGAALIQRKHLEEQDRSTAFWASVGVGLAFTAGGVLASGPLADFYGEPSVQPLFAVLSLSFLFAALGTTQNALLTREMSFKRLELRTMLAGVAGAVVGVVTAVRGYGAWAIVGQQLTVTVVSTLLVWRLSSWRPRLAFSPTRLRALGGFSANVLGVRTLFYIGRNVDNLLVGRFLGATALGAYALAYNLMLLPMNRVAGPVQQVLFPAFSRLQDDRERMTAVWLRANRLIAAACAPLLLGLIVVAPDFVSVVLGERWHEATPVLRILAIVGLLQALQRLNGSVFMACDKTGTLFRFSLVAVAVNTAAFVVGLRWGIVGVAAAYATSTAAFQALYLRMTIRLLDVSLRTAARAIARVMAAAIAAAACAAIVRELLASAGGSAAARLAACVVVAGLAYVIACRWIAPDVLAEIRNLRSMPRAPGSREAVRTLGSEEEER